MKVLKIIKKVILTILLVIFFAFTITMTILLLSYNKYGLTQFEDTTLLIIKKNSGINFIGSFILFEGPKV